MAVEIERKYLVIPEKWHPQGKKEFLTQGYLSLHPERVVRIRVKGDNAFLTIKSKLSGFSRSEFEYPVPKADAEQIIKNCDGAIVSKYRYTFFSDGHVWEVDEFLGKNGGLLLAEVELKAEDEKIILPDWIGKEVTFDSKYYNASLATLPFEEWK